VSRIDGLVLAAGASRRMGRPKPLEIRDGKTWLANAVAALRPHVRRVWVAVGHDAERVRAAHEGADVRWIEADLWEEGMGATLACAVRTIAESDATGIVVVPCDLPDLDARIVARLIESASAPGRTAAACAYGGVLGIPVCIDRVWFDRFAELRGDRGARDRLRTGDPAIAAVDWPEGARDRDRSL